MVSVGPNIYQFQTFNNLYWWYINRSFSSWKKWWKMIDLSASKLRLPICIFIIEFSTFSLTIFFWIGFCGCFFLIVSSIFLFQPIYNIKPMMYLDPIKFNHFCKKTRLIQTRLLKIKYFFIHQNEWFILR